MRCLSCKTNYVSKEYNKLVYLKLTEGNCIISCIDNLFLTKEIECVSTCPFGTYEYIPNNRCVDECPSSFIINEEKTRCIFSSFNNETTFSEFKEIVFSNINDFVDAFKVIKGYDFIAQITPEKDLDPIEQIKQRISGIDLGDCIDILKDIYNISKDEDLIVLVTETKEINKNNDEDNKLINLGKNVKIAITDIRGNILNMSYYNNDINVLKYIGDEEKINMNNAREFADKGIDIFNASDDFFNDKCKYYDINLDITIKDRREDIFQDVNFCGDNCIYNGINYSLNIANCSCNTNSLQDNPKYDEDDEKNEKLNLHNLANSFTSEILKFNFDVIK